jgi:thioesterase domain-containing protein
MLFEIERARGHRLPFATLFQDTTIEALAVRVGAFVRAEPEPSSIVLNADAPGRPFAFVHGDVRGGGWYCRRLAQLADPESPFIVLPTLGSDEDESQPLTVEGMAARHVAELRKIQPKGPYRVGGFCIGGLIALEMAHQLREAGEDVERLVVIDTAATNVRVRWMDPVADLVARGATPIDRLDKRAGFLRQARYYEARVRYLRHLSVGQKLKWGWGKARGVVAAAGSAVAAPEQNRAAREADTVMRTEMAAGPGSGVLRAQARAASAYVPKPYDGEIDLIWASEIASKRLADPTRGWRFLAKQVTVHPIQSSHLGLITNLLPVLAERLHVCLLRKDGYAASRA